MFFFLNFAKHQQIAGAVAVRLGLAVLSHQAMEFLGITGAFLGFGGAKAPGKI